jgi:hypothetical protein
LASTGETLRLCSNNPLVESGQGYQNVKFFTEDGACCQLSTTRWQWEVEAGTIITLPTQEIQIMKKSPRTDAMQCNGMHQLAAAFDLARDIENNLEDLRDKVRGFLEEFSWMDGPEGWEESTDILRRAVLDKENVE